jgi:hypothetical protein
MHVARWNWVVVRRQCGVPTAGGILMIKGLKFRFAATLGCLAAGVCLSLTGCTGLYSGQNLPSGYYLGYQIQYFPPGPEFKLSREAAAQKEYRDTQTEREGVPQ